MPVEPLDEVPEAELPVVEVARVEPVALPEAEPDAPPVATEPEAEAPPEVARVSVGTATVVPDSEATAEEPAAAAVVVSVAGALVTVGTDAGGVTWI